MLIFILRHAIAEDAAPGGRDSDRALTSEGRDKLRSVLKRASKAIETPSLILSSPYVRARQTAEIAASALGYTESIVNTGALTPDAAPHQVWEEIRTHRDAERILLASHEPLVSQLVSYLLGAPALQVEMKKAALVCIEIVTFRGEPRGVLKWMLTPKVAHNV